MVLLFYKTKKDQKDFKIAILLILVPALDHKLLLFQKINFFFIDETRSAPL